MISQRLPLSYPYHVRIEIFRARHSQNACTEGSEQKPITMAELKMTLYALDEELKLNKSSRQRVYSDESALLTNHNNNNNKRRPSGQYNHNNSI